MNQNIYFYASTEENLTTIPKDTQVYDKLIKCILKKACELMNDKGIRYFN